MALRADLRWEDENLVVHGVATEVVKVRTMQGDREQERWVLLCKARQFVRKFPPSFVDKKVTCVGCIAAEQ